MPYLLFCFLILALNVVARSQNKYENFIIDRDKPVLDTNVFNNWPKVQNGLLSYDGRYACYSIINQPSNGKTLVVRSLRGGWEERIIGGFGAVFTANSKQLLFISDKDSLCFLNLGGGFAEVIPNVKTFELFSVDEMEWLAYSTQDSSRELVIKNLVTGGQKVFADVRSFRFSKLFNTLIVLREIINQRETKCSIEWIRFPELNSKIVWEGRGVQSLTLDNNGSQIAFTVLDSADCMDIWYCNLDSPQTKILYSQQMPGVLDRFKIAGFLENGFSNDGTRLFVKLKEKDRPKQLVDLVMVDVWSYLDNRLQSEQQLKLTPRFYKAVVNIKSSRLIRLEEDDEALVIFTSRDDIGFITHNKGGGGEAHWNINAQDSFILISTINGERKSFPLKVDIFNGISPDGKYVIGKKRIGSGDIYSYRLSDGLLSNLTKSISCQPDIIYDNVSPSYSKGWLQIAGWSNCGYLLVYDRHDIWRLDLNSKSIPLCITKGFGRQNHLVFRLGGNYRNKVINGDENLLITAFSLNDKKSGFYRARIDASILLEKLYLGPFMFHLPYDPSNIWLKARDTSVFMILRYCAHQQRNYFLTSDFRTFNPLSFVYPESEYNWLRTELHSWRSLNGRMLQGVLYKPENFDSTRKYPIVFNYYENRHAGADVLYDYMSPGPITDNINIPWMVSHGYLVFVPDIFYKPGRPGEGVYNSVISAVKYLKKYSWIDTKRMGLQGHSFAGWETNYLIAHSNIFSAAMSSSGVSDFISNFGGLFKIAGNSLQNKFEVAQYRMYTTPWANPDLFIANSPIFYAYKVSTPLLMMNNREDPIVLFEQGVEFFTALRRLGKRVWMLQYDNEGHSLSSTKASLIHTIRVMQFFDHYLKGTPPPKWMTRGIQASKKGLYYGLELDNEIKTPGFGLLISPEKNNKKFK